MPSDGQVPDGWRVVRLGDVADVAFSGVDKKTVDGEEPVQLCNYTDVFYNRRISPGMELMAATANSRERDRYSLRKGDVLFTKDSETPDEIGIPAYVTEDMPNVLCGYHLGLARPRCGVVEGAYLTSALQSRESRRQFARVANGVTRFGLTLGATIALPILLPPLPEQRAIAGVLDGIDEAIERTEAVIAATARLRDSLLHELLTRGVPGSNVKTLADAPLEIIDGDRGKNYPKQRDFSESGHCLFLNTANVTTAGFSFSSRAFISSDRDQRLGKGKLVRDDVVLTTRGTVGNSAHFDGSVSYDHLRINSGMVILRPSKHDLYPGYLYAFVRSQVFLSQVSAFRTGSAQPQLPIRVMERIKIALPPLCEQRAIAGALGAIDAAIVARASELDRLQATKASTSDALLTGRLRTQSVENGK